MGYRYFVFLATGNRVRPSAPTNSQVAALQQLGLQRRVDLPGVHIFASQQTPVLVSPHRHVLIGHLFDRNGMLVSDGSILPEHESDSRFMQQILRDYWGEYVAICLIGDHQTLFREPSGGMPAVYTWGKTDGFLTSDISIAVKLGLYKRKIDWSYISNFLAFPNLKTSTTALEDINELLPGCSVQLQTSRPVARVEWSPWDFVACHKRFALPRDAADATRSTVQSVVEAWTQVDRDVLLELSGGLDSSIVAACLQGTDARVRCCTLTTEVAGVDERRYAELMAGQLGAELDLCALELEQARFDFPPTPQAVVPAMAPLQFAVDAAMSAAGSAHAGASHFTGGGGDTVFCYLATAAPAVDAIRERGVTASIDAIRQLSVLHNCTFWKAARFTIKKLLRRPRRLAPDLSFLSATLSPHFPADAHPWIDQPVGALPGDRERIADLVGTMAFRASSPRRTETWLRMPLLSQPVLETCLRTPSWMAIAGGRNRAVARAAFAHLLPPEILNRRSKGTFVNYSGAAYQRNKADLRHFLLSGLLRERDLLDAGAMERFFDRELPPRDTSFMRLFELSMIENWLRHQS